MLITQKLMRCCLQLLRVPQGKTTNAVVTGMLLDFYFTLKFQIALKDTHDLLLNQLKSVLTLSERFLRTKTPSLTSWLVSRYMLRNLMRCLESWMDSHLKIIFGIGRHLYDLPFCWTFKYTLLLNSWDIALI